MLSIPLDLLFFSLLISLLISMNVKSLFKVSSPSSGISTAHMFIFPAFGCSPSNLKWSHREFRSIVIYFAFLWVYKVPILFRLFVLKIS